jgi:TPR repeat protein
MKLHSIALMAMLALPFLSNNVRAADSGPLCDQLAGEPEDADLPGPPGKGIGWEAIDVATAEPACRQAVKDHPDERRYLVELGRVLWKQGTYDEAMAQYQSAMDKGSVIAISALGLFYQNGDGVAEDDAKAAEYFQQAIDKGSVAGMSNLAYLYQYDFIPGKGAADALALYERGMATGDTSSMIDLGYLYWQGKGTAKDPARAQQLFRQAIAGPDPYVAADGKNALAWMLVLTGGDLTEAEKLVNQAIAEARPGDDASRSSSLDTLAMIEHRTGRNDLAASHEEQSIGLGYDSAAVYDRLGDIYQALGRRAGALAAWQKALMLPAPDPNDEPEFDPVATQKKIDATPG